MFRMHSQENKTEQNCVLSIRFRLAFHWTAWYYYYIQSWVVMSLHLDVNIIFTSTFDILHSAMFNYSSRCQLHSSYSDFIECRDTLTTQIGKRVKTSRKELSQWLNTGICEMMWSARMRAHISRALPFDCCLLFACTVCKAHSVNISSTHKITREANIWRTN